MTTIVFDVNETLSDMAPMAERFADLGLAPGLAATWFAGTLRDGLALAVHATSAPFADVARDVLLTLFAREPALNRDPQAAADHVLDGFTSLPVHPDVVPGVRALRAAGHRLVTLSNGSASVAHGLLGRAGIAEEFDAVLSVEDAAAWKPHPAAYAHAVGRCGLPAAELLLVAVHPWDIDGAARAGFRTAYLDRSARGYPGVFTAPDHTVERLEDLAAALQT